MIFRIKNLDFISSLLHFLSFHCTLVISEKTITWQDLTLSTTCLVRFCTQVYYSAKSFLKTVGQRVAWIKKKKSSCTNLLITDKRTKELLNFKSYIFQKKTLLRTSNVWILQDKLNLLLQDQGKLSYMLIKMKWNERWATSILWDVTDDNA